MEVILREDVENLGTRGQVVKVASGYARNFLLPQKKAVIANDSNRKIVEQNRKCTICQDAFTNYNDIVPDHIHPRGMGGAWRDDHPDNIQAVHWWCNGEKGSSRI